MQHMALLGMVRVLWVANVYTPLSIIYIRKSKYLFWVMYSSSWCTYSPVDTGGLWWA